MSIYGMGNIYSLVSSSGFDRGLTIGTVDHTSNQVELVSKPVNEDQASCGG